MTWPMRPAMGLLAAGLLAACAIQQGPGTAGRDARASLEAVAGRLPVQVADFERGETVWHEQARPGLGVTVDYAGPARSAVATVSVYDRGQAAIPADIAAAAVQQEFALAVREVLDLAEDRTSQNLAERDRTRLDIPGQAPLQCATLQGTYGRQPVQTLLCLGTASGRYLKVQVTAPTRQVRPVDPLPFVVGIARAARG
ncbi:hypothetical protein [Falsiroseomonas sp. E2-1-a20]|uniref:hypothetical protein n=1 Tax=Falsiroseomonas sp. E2-1-a20 TaxID=3239300 RepID=UPI003F3072F6